MHFSTDKFLLVVLVLRYFCYHYSMYILFDIGGTKMRIAGSRDGKTISEALVHETPQDFEQASAALQDAVKKIAEGETIEAYSGGIPGVVSQDGTISSSPHIQSFEGQNIKKLFGNILVPFYIENDAVLNGLGEATFGAGKGYEIVVYLTVSTGVGGARIVNKKIDAHRVGFEPGHQFIDYKNNLTLEAAISGSGIKARYGVTPPEIKDPKIWDTIHFEAAIGIYNTVLHWSPDVIVLGGAVTFHHLSLPTIENHLKQMLAAFPVIPKLVRAEFEDTAGLYGALSYLQQMT